MIKSHENPVGEFTTGLVAQAGSFVIELFNNGTQVGYVGVNDDGYCVIVTSKSSALTFTAYVKDNTVYYQTQYQGSTKYLSVSDHIGARDYVGLFSWHGATGWKQANNHLISDYNNQALSMYSTDDGYLYAWDAYDVLDVTEV